MFDWEESAFVGLRKLYRRIFVSPRERRREAVRATLQERRRTLLLLAQAIAARPLTLFETDDAQLCREERIFLPHEFAAAATIEGNAELFTLKAIIAGLALRHGWNRNEGALSELVQRADDEFPGLAEKIAHAQAALPPDADIGKCSADFPTRTPRVFPGLTRSPARPIPDPSA